VTQNLNVLEKMNAADLHHLVLLLNPNQSFVPKLKNLLKFMVL
jgi:hypothetical protein